MQPRTDLHGALDIAEATEALDAAAIAQKKSSRGFPRFNLPTPLRPDRILS
jgi:hypothetical protein